MITLNDIVDASDGKRYENYVAMCCPFHDDQHPSLFAYEDGFYCKSCGARGNLTKLYKQLTHYMDFGAKSRNKGISDFRNPFNKWLGENSIGSFCHEAHAFLKRYPDQGVYLRQRGIAPLIDELKLGYWDGYYIFPVMDRWGEIVTAVARAGKVLQESKDIRYVLPNGTEPQLYIPNWELLKSEKVIYVPFGIIDALTLYSLGKAVATGITGKQIDAKLFASFRKRIIVIPDLGEEKSAYKLAGELGWRGSVKRLDYAYDEKDPNEVFCKRGNLQLSAMVA